VRAERRGALRAFGGERTAPGLARRSSGRPRSLPHGACARNLDFGAAVLPEACSAQAVVTRSGAGHTLPGVVVPPRVPRAAEAVLPEDKLAGYALDPAHPRGRHKARVFSSALGIEQENWRYLRDQLADGIVGAAVEGMRITPFGLLYETVVLVDGLNGATVPVAAIWIIEGEQPPRLVSTWVDIP
jgi:hypothetical protein